jgi:dipeptidyl aminopeptidase/acylaminoacyl peptidase
LDDQLTTVPAKPSGRTDSVKRVRDPRILVGGLIAFATAAVLIAWLFVSGSGSSPATKRSVATPIKPVAVSASGLSTLARAVGQPIYWAGQRPGYLYELTRTANGNVYVRYLPPGVDAGAKGANYLVVGTYPFPGAFATLQKLAQGRGINLPGGGLALVDKRYPKSVHLAFPKVDYQVEVFDPSPKRALSVASSGEIRSVG